jgi:16S rRNA (guanine966-N2)-methyltransferase
VRITGGTARGIPLRVPSRGPIRPATDRLRESVFSSLGPSVEGRRILDLFAGTGAYGLEALSRGAESVTFVEKDRNAVACLKANLAAVAKSLSRTDLRTDVAQADVLSWRPPADGEFDLVFADPPFSRLDSIVQPLFRFLSRLPIPGGNLRVVLEMPGHYETASQGWLLERRVGKGRDQPTCCLFRRDAE